MIYSVLESAVVRQLLVFAILLAVIVLVLPVAAESQRTFRELRSFSAAEARQGVAVDATHFFAITNRAIGKYDKHSGERVAAWTSPEDSHVRHLNGGTVVGEKLFCGHSNWPETPFKNTVEIFDVTSLTHRESRVLDMPDKALNWVDYHNGAWWAVFGTYGTAESVRRTSLVKFDDVWKEQARWTFPESVIQRFLPNTNSGGSWGPDGLLYVTGHDRPEVYALRLPKTGSILEEVATVPVAAHGQGIAWDRSDRGMLYGIRRKTREIVVVLFSHVPTEGPKNESVAS